MTRAEAQSKVDAVTQNINGFKGVTDSDAFTLFASEGKIQNILALKQDPIKRLGPTKESIYPWNCVDYLEMETTN